MQARTFVVVGNVASGGAGIFAVMGGAAVLAPYIGGYVTHARVSYIATGGRVLGNVNNLYLGSVAAPFTPMWSAYESFTETFAYQGEATFWAGPKAPGLPIDANNQYIWIMSTLYAPVNIQFSLTVWSP